MGTNPIKPIRPVKNVVTTKGPAAPINKPSSRKPSDNLFKMKMKRQGVPGIPKIPDIIPKKVTAKIASRTKRPKLGIT